MVLTEVGWPSQGLQRMGAIASPVNQGIFLRNFVREAKKQDIEYFIIEGFDQPWKAEFEGGVGAYWGVWDGHAPEARPAGHPGQLPELALAGRRHAGLGLPFVLWVMRAELGLVSRGRFFRRCSGRAA